MMLRGTIILMLSAVAAAQDAVPPEGQEKSLDDLLGIAEDDTTQAAKESARTQREKLKRTLSVSETQDTIVAAIAAMRRSATLLSEKEAGTAVQRLQEDVIARLDALIESAQQQQQQQSSSSSSSSSASSSDDSKEGSKGEKGSADKSEAQRRKEAQERAQQGKGQKGQEGAGQPGGSGLRPGELPPGEEAVEGGIIEETEAEWGSLPPRTREILRQGVREKMSSMYKRSTEAYYRRIAQEAKR